MAWLVPRSPTTGPTAGRTSTSRCWSAAGFGCGPPGRSRGRARSTSSSTPAAPSAPAPTRPPGSASSTCWSSRPAGEAEARSTTSAPAPASSRSPPPSSAGTRSRGYDHEEASIEAATANAEVNGVEAGFTTQPPPGVAPLAPTDRRQHDRPGPARVGRPLAAMAGVGEDSQSLPAVAPPSPPPTTPRSSPACSPSSWTRSPQHFAAVGPRRARPPPRRRLGRPPPAPRLATFSLAGQRRQIAAGECMFPPCRSPRSSIPATRSRSSCTCSRSSWPSGRPSATRSSSRSRRSTRVRPRRSSPASRDATSTWSTRAWWSSFSPPSTCTVRRRLGDERGLHRRRLPRRSSPSSRCSTPSSNPQMRKAKEIAERDLKAGDTLSDEFEALGAENRPSRRAGRADRRGDDLLHDV